MTNCIRLGGAAGCVLWLGFAAASPSSAADVSVASAGWPATSTVIADPANRFEARFGVFAHGLGSVEKNTADLNGELATPRLFTFDSPWSFLVPRLMAGGLVNLSGRTNAAYTGALWTIPVFDGFFIEGFVGPAIHDGSLLGSPTQSALGCRILFNVGGSIGYRFNDRWSILGTFDHLSNGNRLFDTDCGTNKGPNGKNQGLNNYGIRLGYSF